MSSKCRYLKENIHSAKIWNPNYAIHLETERDSRRHTPYSAGHCPPPTTICQSPPNTFNRKFYKNSRNKRNFLGSNGSSWNCQTHCLTNAAQRFGHMPKNGCSPSLTREWEVPVLRAMEALAVPRRQRLYENQPRGLTLRESLLVRKIRAWYSILPVPTRSCNRQWGILPKKLKRHRISKTSSSWHFQKPFKCHFPRRGAPKSLYPSDWIWGECSQLHVCSTPTPV